VAQGRCANLDAELTYARPVACSAGRSPSARRRRRPSSSRVRAHRKGRSTRGEPMEEVQAALRKRVEIAA
jgi:hypothetical protein